MSLFGLLGIASDGLAAQSAALDATGQNVANANTPGYSWVTANLQTTATGDSFAGSVRVGGMTRSVDQFAVANVLSEQGKSGAADARSTAMTATEGIIAPSGDTTIGDDVDSFFASFTALEASPSDTSARTAVLQNATDLAQNISTTAAGLQSQRAQLLQQAQGAVGELNSDLEQIAELNGKIAGATAQGAQPTDMEDQRDALVSTVSSQIGAQVLQDPQGNYTLLSSGTALVTGTSAAQVAVTQGTDGNLKITANRDGGSSIDITANTNDGTLGGIREARDTDLPNFASQLDTFAANFANAVNGVQAAGYGLDGVSGRPLFTPPTTTAGAAAAFAVDPGIAGNPNMIAASTTAGGVPGGNDNAIAMSQLSTQALAGGPTPSDTFGIIAANVGSASASAKSESDLRTQTVTQAQNLSQSTSGVSLDEEMTKMTQFQNAYEASSKVLQTAEALLQGLMQEIG